MYTIDEFSEANCTNFLLFLKDKWDEIHNKTNIFRYKIDNTSEKVIDGYLLQLNPDRCSKRRTPEKIESVCQPFNKNKFNFTKVSPEEIITSLRDKSLDEVSTVLVNVSPISRYHSLFCPALNSCLPQIATEQDLNLVIKLMLITSDRAFRIGFNSLCALASVNHLHYHLFVEKQILPVENAECIHLIGPVFCLYNYPVPSFCFQVRQEDCTLNIAGDVNKLLQYFLTNDIAHNIFMTKGRKLNGGTEEIVRILVWPRKSSAGAKQLEAFNVAVCELSGWFPVYNVDDFERLQASDLEAELRKWRVDNFDELCNEIKNLFS